MDHYENFPVASILLPRRLRGPVALIYRFAREADDFADEGDAHAPVRLEQLDHFSPTAAADRDGRRTPEIPWFSDLGEAIRRHDLPIGAFFDLLSAFSQDVDANVLRSFGEVLDYCRRSANPVGRLLLALYGESAREPLAWSDAICSSLQLINFLQDVAIDYRKGRAHLPLENEGDARRAGVTEQQIAQGATSRRPVEKRFVMDFQIGRASDRCFISAAPFGRVLKGRVEGSRNAPDRGRRRAYCLEKIEAVGGDVFRRRPVLRLHDWPGMLLRALKL